MFKLLSAIALLSAFLLTGCQAAIWGNLAVMGLAVGIFVGTLGLGRAGLEANNAESSTASRH